MTSQSFTRELEAYYGKYSRPRTKENVERYLGRYSDDFRLRLCGHVELTYSGETRFTPDIKIIDKAAKELARQGGDVPDYKLIEERPGESENREVQGKLLELMATYDDSPEVQRVLAERKREEREGVEISGLE